MEQFTHKLQFATSMACISCSHNNVIVTPLNNNNSNNLYDLASIHWFNITIPDNIKLIFRNWKVDTLEDKYYLNQFKSLWYKDNVNVKEQTVLFEFKKFRRKQ